MSQSELMDECVDYIRSHAILIKVLDGFRDKYLSYGRLAGTVVLENVTVEERIVLEGFFQRNYHGKTQVRITAVQFETALQQSRFAELDGEDVLQAFYGTLLFSRKSKKEQAEARWHRLVASVQAQAKTASAKRWIDSLANAEMVEPFAVKMRVYLKKRDNAAGGCLKEVERLLVLGVKILNRLPLMEPVYLPVFAAELTGDPHAFDKGRKDGGFLALVIQWLCQGMPMHNILERQRCYLQVGLLFDDMSNYVMALGMRAWKKDGREHLGMAGFFFEREPVHLPLSDIVQWTEVCCPNDRLYMVENPSIYAVLCNHWREKQAIVCVAGQPNLSVYELLDRLSAGTEIWYAGDFDPEGLQIAERLADYYNGVFNYWRMSAEDYSKSCPAKPLNDERLKKLEKIKDPRLSETVDAILSKKAAGYQEKLLHDYIKDMA